VAIARELACRTCGRSFLHKPGAGLHCTTKCEENYADAIADAKQCLEAAGFVVSPAAPNLYVKNGVAVTIEQVIHEGLEETLAAHDAAVAAHQ
jgi:hypothetical protein